MKLVSFQDTNEDESGGWKHLGGTHLEQIAWVRNTNSSFTTSAKGKLYVEFTDGMIYEYEGISYNIFYYLWRRVGRRGTYFHYYIRTSYPYKRIR